MWDECVRRTRGQGDRGTRGLARPHGLSPCPLVPLSPSPLPSPRLRVPASPRLPLNVALWMAALIVSGWITTCTRPASAAPTQEDVFKSIQESVGEKTEFDTRPVVLFACAGGGILLLVWLMGRRSKRAAVPKSLNHPGRLMKEVLREVPLKSAEVRQLKTIASSVASQAGEEPSPLTLLLCPSLLAKGLNAASTRGSTMLTAGVDRKIVAQVVRKMRINEPPQ